MSLRIAYKKDEAAEPVHKPLTRKEQVARFSAVLEKKMRRRDFEKAVEKHKARIDALGLTLMEIYHKLIHHTNTTRK